MDIKAISAAQKYSAAIPAVTPDENASAFMKDIALDFADTLARSEHTAKDSMIGDADPHALVQALAQTELVVETAVAVRNKVVEAYQEILRMPV
ncbi:flagellar hook-basal body complex protein FliE [Sulfitobacter sp.]|uniref:flagellar hook-basal body complex protein FliE n=1 Tax=Sulfitobacter sp. TaxID=1903071 RepID=UPI003566FE7E